MKRYSHFVAMLYVAKSGIEGTIKRNPTSILFGLIFPLIFVIGSKFFDILKDKQSIVVGVLSTSDTNQVLYHTLESIPNIEMVYLSSDKQIQNVNSLQWNKYNLIVSIPQVSNNNANKILIYSRSDNDKIIIKTIKDYLYLKQLSSQPNAIPYQDQIQVIDELKKSNKSFNLVDYVLPGQIGITLLTQGVFGITFLFFSLRKDKVLKRMVATPIKKIYIIIGETLSRVVIQLFAVILLVVISVSFLGFHLVHGWSTFFDIIICSLVGLFAFYGIGFIVAGIVKSETSIPPLANLIVLPQFILSATIVPISIFPKWIQIVSYCLPLTYFNNALRKICMDGLPLWQTYREMLVLVLFGILFYSIISKTFKWE